VNEASAASAGRFRIITPSDPERRGCQLSIEVSGDAEALLKALHAGGAICDLRRPNVIRVAPTPMYNSFRDCWEFGRLLCESTA
jgi:kynureninase